MPKDNNDVLVDLNSTITGYEIMKRFNSLDEEETSNDLITKSVNIDNLLIKHYLFIL